MTNVVGMACVHILLTAIRVSVMQGFLVKTVKLIVKLLKVSCEILLCFLSAFIAI